MLLDNLNEEQKLAVTSTEGFIRVIAGAGSGKTRALSHRFAYLVNEIGILPSNILCVTFTNKAANEMRSRIRKLTGDNDTGYISTFHGFCVSVLQEDSNAVQYPKSFLVLDNSDIDAMLQIIYEERGLTLRQMTFSNARDMIEDRKLFKEPEYYNDMIRMTLDEIQQKYLAATKPEDIIFYGYLYQEKKCFGLDYNDLIKFTLYIFETDADIRLKWQQRLEYIMIDEFQDIDLIQYQLMSVLCDYHKNLFIVGDPDQTIYTWRGANVRYLLDFDKNFPNVQTIMMMKNYRSTPEILAVANSLISKNVARIKKDLIAGLETPTAAADTKPQPDTPTAAAGTKPLQSTPTAAADTKPLPSTPTAAADTKPLQSTPTAAADTKPSQSTPTAAADTKPLQSTPTAAADTKPSLTTPTAAAITHPLPLYFHAKSAEEEAEFIASECQRLLASGCSASDMVVMYRAHYISRVIEETFQKKKIPYTLFSGVPFFDRMEIKDSLSYLRMIAYKDDLSFLRVCNAPKRNIGERRIKFLKDWAGENHTSLYEALKLNIENEIFAGTKAQDFIKLIEKFSASYSKMQISEVFSAVMNESGYEKALRTEGSQERLDNLAELKQSIYEYETSCGEECTLENYLAHAALFTSSDAGITKGAIRFMTVHTAKGLEFPVVFLCGMNENMFPSKKVDSWAAMEEERRLAFVAFTRAQKQLYLTEAQGMNHGVGYRFPSRFIFDVDKGLLKYEKELPDELVHDAKNYIEESTETLKKMAATADLKVGDKVSHGILGNGIITEIDSNAHTYTVQFEGILTPRKMSFKAPLKKM